MGDADRSAGRSSSPRRARRFHTARVRLRSPRLNARLLNLSAVGAGIETTEPPRIGATVQCELESEQTFALIPGEVRWCKLGRVSDGEGDDIVPIYRAGIQFNNGTPQNLLRILRAAGLDRSRGEA